MCKAVVLIGDYLQVLVCFSVLINQTSSQGINPSILQDTRDLPKTDGTFGFLYRTEDGIAHAAKGDQDGIVHGRFTYTDPTGLKVNYNYNAGSRVTPKYNYDDAPVPQYRRLPAELPREPQRAPRPAPVEIQEPAPQQYDPQYEAQPQYVPRPRYEPRPQYEPEPAQYVRRTPQRRPRVNYRARRPINRNEVYDYDY